MLFNDCMCEDEMPSQWTHTQPRSQQSNGHSETPWAKHTHRKLANDERTAAM